MPSTFSLSLDVPFRSEWGNVDLLRTSVLNCLSAMLGKADGAQTVAMVTGELLENAVKYGDWSAPCQFRLHVEGTAGGVKVSVDSPVRPDDPGVRELQETLAWIKTFPTTADAYRARLLAAASAPRELDTSRLGLVRIAYEGNCELSATVTGNVLRMTGAIPL